MSVRDTQRDDRSDGQAGAARLTGVPVPESGVAGGVRERMLIDEVVTDWSVDEYLAARNAVPLL